MCPFVRSTRTSSRVWVGKLSVEPANILSHLHFHFHSFPLLSLRLSRRSLEVVTSCITQPPKLQLAFFLLLYIRPQFGPQHANMTVCQHFSTAACQEIPSQTVDGLSKKPFSIRIFFVFLPSWMRLSEASEQPLNYVPKRKKKYQTSSSFLIDDQSFSVMPPNSERSSLDYGLRRRGRSRPSSNSGS